MPEEVHTPGLTTVEQVARELGVPGGALLKAYPVILDSGEMKLVIVRGDHRVNEIKLRLALAASFALLDPDEVSGGSDRRDSSARSAPNFRSCSTRRWPAVYVTGANKPDTHLQGVEPGRDFPSRPWTCARSWRGIRSPAR